MNKNRRELKVLSVCYYILGGLGMLYAMLMGVMFAGWRIAGSGVGQPGLWELLVVQLLVLLYVAHAAGQLLAGFWLRNALAWKLCMAVAIVTLIASPLSGTICFIHVLLAATLSIATIVVLARKSVRELFKAVRAERVRKRAESAREGYQ